MLRSSILLSSMLLLSGCATVQEEPGRPVTDAESKTTAMATPVATPVAPPGFEVCELVGRDSIVKVLSTDMGTRYTLCRLDGAPVAADLDAEALRKLRPDLDPASMQADWGRGPLMLMDRVD